MTYAYRQTVPIGESVYRKIAEQLGTDPMPGLLVHLVIRRSDNELEYIDVWDSEEACERAFDDRIHPAVYNVFKQMGFEPDGEPVKTPIDIVEVRGLFAGATQSI